MNIRSITFILMWLLYYIFTTQAQADSSKYCPQNHRYINIGMSSAEVIAACGPPLSKEQLRTPLMQKIPVMQLLYNSQGAPTAFYGVWSLPVGINTGAQLEINIVDNKIKSIRLNSSSTNAASVCGGAALQIGDPVGKVYGACGNPALVNNTYINQPIPSTQKPEIWIYQVDNFQPPFRLTFLNDKLQSID